ncbi:pentatricopeptide repeat-containing protein At5g64320, mitochondrial-like isoform X2 [Phragmites australis]|uniref:pentatricopeptide repeat-containing protein At5g64320, mitochondrial-like isoform X2 n=1 Tax=Phragmites australis TaxID=29695 RepID=UPI002D79E858|nr:pentatricopeptide repeat-containing protein At5g64320, mitochondrial-like isoform X2 [Phragmites australis]
MASSASAAALLVLPFPSSSSSSEDSDEARLLLPVPEAASPPPQQQRRWQGLERDCNVLMKALTRAGDVDQVVDLFAELRHSASRAGVVPNVLCYNTLLNALAEAGREGEARKAFDEMLAAGVLPNASSLNILVKLYAWWAVEFDTAYELIFRLRGFGVEADVGTYSTLITGLCRAGRLDEAWGVIDLMLEEGCLPLVHTYTPIVQGYCREGRIEEAKKLIAGMECFGCPPNVVTYNVLIRALCDDARFDEVREILAESTTKGWKPSTVTYNTYMNGLFKKGMAKEALQQLDVMLEAISLLERSTALNWCAGVVAYNTVMSRLCDMGRWLGVLKLVTDMIKKGIIPNTRTFNILIHSLCIGGKSSIAKSLVCNQGFAANVVTYNTLIHWFYYWGKHSEVKHLIADMDAAKITPDDVTFTISVDGLCREGNFDKATRCFLTSLGNGFSRDLLTVLINRLVHSDRIGEILRIFRGMKEKGKGFPPDYSIFDYTIRSCCRVGFCHYRTNFKLDIILNTMLGLGEEVNSAHKGQGNR